MTNTMRTRIAAGAGLVVAAGMLLAGCATPPPAETTTATAEPVDFTACAVSDEGSWQDKSFNQAAYEGLTKAETELGVQIADAESEDMEDFLPNLQSMVDASCDVTFAVGFNFSIDGSIFTIADENPDSHFVWIDGWNQGQANLKPITYSMNQSSYLAGYLAAGYSTTKVVGTYGGSDIDAVTDFMIGYQNGALQWGLDNGTEVTVLGMDSFTDGFGDTEGAKQISAGQIAEGADVIFPVAGALFESTAAAIDESGKDVVFIGVDKDIAVTSPQYADKVLTSAEKRMTQAVFDVIGSLVDGEEFTIDPYVGTLENDGTALSAFGEFDSAVSDELKAKLDELKAGIIDGSIDPLATPAA